MKFFARSKNSELGNFEMTDNKSKAGSYLSAQLCKSKIYIKCQIRALQN